MTSTRNVLPALALVITTLAASSCSAEQSANAQPEDQKPAPLSAAASDPNTLGWMEGFPPPPEKLVIDKPPTPNGFNQI